MAAERRRMQSDAVRSHLLSQLAGVAVDLEKLLEVARGGDGKQPRCKGCGSFIPGISNLKLGDIMVVIRELKTLLPTQLEHEGTIQHVGVVELPMIVTRVPE